MGWFSGKDVTQVATSVQRVIEDDMVPNSLRAGVLKSIFEDTDLSEQIVEEFSSSIGIRADRYYDYGKTKYMYGLPSGQRLSSTAATPEVEKVLAQIEGGMVIMDYCHYGRSNSLHIGWMTLVSQYGYDPSSNELKTMTAEKGTPVYLKDMVVVMPPAVLEQLDPLELAQWGDAPTSGFTPDRFLNTGTGKLGFHTPINIEPSALNEYVKVTVSYQYPMDPEKPDVIPSVINETFTISVAQYRNDIEYYHARYWANGVVKYWMYESGSGLYPTLDTFYETTPAENGTYFPFSYFRFKKTSEMENSDTESYLSCKKLVEKLGIDFDVIAEGINSNPDIKDVEQAMMIVAVPANTEHPLERRYLFDYFNKLYLEGEGAYGQDFFSKPKVWAYFNTANLALNENRNVTVIEDKRFKMALNNSGIYKRRVSGSIGDIGTCFSKLEESEVPIELQDSETGDITTQYIKVKAHVFQKQVTPTLYEEIRVIGLRLQQFIYKSHKTTADTNDKHLLIPVDRAVIEDYSLIEKEELISRALHYIFNSRVVTHLEWYETDIFQIIMVIIAIVITIYTYGADGGSAIAAALGLGGTAGLIATIIVNLAIGLALQQIFTLAVKVLGPDLAMVLAVLAVVYGAYNGIQLGSLAKVPYAGELLIVANGLQSAAMNSKFEDLAEAYGEFEKFVEEQLKLLDQAQDLLTQSPALNPFILFGEKPSDYYNRTVHSGNIGVLGIDAVTYYCDIALTLPTTNDSLGVA